MDTLIQQQRLQHIVASYTLAGNAGEQFDQELLALLDSYPGELVELALAEVLVENWLRYPLPRGMVFLHLVQNRLADWQADATVSTFLTPSQFEQVAGLTPRGFTDGPPGPVDFADAQPLALQRRLRDRHDPTD
jgi:hypothetical protein